MRPGAPVPGSSEQSLDKFLNNHMAPSSSRVPALYRETTMCHSYMCIYAYGCSEKTNRPAQVLMRRCIRYMPEELRIKPGVSDLALDLLAKHRKTGQTLGSKTTAILDELRPNGPLRKTA